MGYGKAFRVDVLKPDDMPPVGRVYHVLVTG